MKSERTGGLNKYEHVFYGKKVNPGSIGGGSGVCNEGK